MKEIIMHKCAGQFIRSSGALKVISNTNFQIKRYVMKNQQWFGGTYRCPWSAETCRQPTWRCILSYSCPYVGPIYKQSLQHTCHHPWPKIACDEERSVNKKVVAYFEASGAFFDTKCRTKSFNYITNHPSKMWPLIHKVAIRENRVRFAQIGFHQLWNPWKLWFWRVSDVFNSVFTHNFLWYISWRLGCFRRGLRCLLWRIFYRYWMLLRSHCGIGLKIE